MRAGAVIRSLREGGDVEGALERARQFISDDSTNLDAWMELGWTYRACLRDARERGEDDAYVAALREACRTLIQIRTRLDARRAPVRSYGGRPSPRTPDGPQGSPARSFAELNSQIRGDVSQFVDAAFSGRAQGSLVHLIEALRENDEECGELARVRSNARRVRDCTMLTPALLSLFLTRLKGLPTDPSAVDASGNRVMKVRVVVALAHWFPFSVYLRPFYERSNPRNARDRERRTAPCLANQLANLYVKAMMARDDSSAWLATDGERSRCIDTILPLLAMRECEEWVYPFYHLANLLSMMGRRDEALRVYAEVLMRSPQLDYMWLRFAEELRPTSESGYEACLFRGLSVSEDGPSSLRLHELAFDLLLRDGRLAEAKREALVDADIRSRHNYAPNRSLDTRSLGDVEPTADNCDLYDELGDNAEDYVAPYLEKTNFYVEWVERDATRMKVIYYRTEQSLQRGLRQRRIIENVEGVAIPSLTVHECYTGVFVDEPRELIGTVTPCLDEAFTQQFIVEFEDAIFIRKDDFGFAETQQVGAFVPPDMVSEQGLEANDAVDGTAVLTLVRDRRTGGIAEKWMVTAIRRRDDDTYKQPIPFEGVLEMPRSAARYGFVNGILVPGSLIGEQGLDDGDAVVGMARYSWDQRKSMLSKTAYEIRASA